LFGLLPAGWGQRIGVRRDGGGPGLGEYQEADWQQDQVSVHVL